MRGPYGWYLEMALAPRDGQQRPGDASSSNGAVAGARRGRLKAPKLQRVSLGKLPAGQVPKVTLEEAVELLQWPKVSSLPQLCGPITSSECSLRAWYSIGPSRIQRHRQVKTLMLVRRQGE